MNIIQNKKSLLSNYDPNMFVTRCIRLTQLLEPHQELICIHQESLLHRSVVKQTLSKKCYLAD